MNHFITQTIFIASVGDEESSFWMQILVFSLLAALWWVYSLIKNGRNEFRDKRQKFIQGSDSHYPKTLPRFQLPRKYISLGKNIIQKYSTKIQHAQLHSTGLKQVPIQSFSSSGTTKQNLQEIELSTNKSKNLHGGMELLGLDFLLSVVENTKGNDQKDVTMRKLNFHELRRREKLNQINSKTLKVYAINQNNTYGKDIQCEAIRELAKRTSYNTAACQKPSQHEVLVNLQENLT